MRFLFALALALAAPAAALAQMLPTARQSDLPRDVAHPARLEQLRYRTAGVEVPARLFVASGPGAHPTVLLLHGFPGTELNLDLARVIQRAGWNVLAIHYRGVWGAPGQFSFGNTIEDARAALVWLRSPAAAAYGVDPRRIVALGHSMGGFDAAMLGDDKALAGYVSISAADMGREAAKADFATGAADEISYTNATAATLAADARTHAADWAWDQRTALMAGRPVLIVTSDDGLASTGQTAATAITAAGGPTPTLIHMVTDHSFNDHRVALAAKVVEWLEARFPPR